LCNFTFLALWMAMLGTPAIDRSACAKEMSVPVTLSGGHETDPQDHGRPVALVAGALRVAPEVFREAFKGVTPSRNGPPSPAEARRNKQALMKVLGPHQVTNERLDEVSNHYRYRPQAGEMWPTTPAKAHAIVEDGKIKSIVVDESGSGYNSPPRAKVQGMAETQLDVSLDFGDDFAKNGSIRSITIVPAKATNEKP
jgi:hypothetical protein